MAKTVSGDTVYESDCYRFAVRCNRTQNAMIERAARKLAITANQLVQRHFETIFQPADSVAETEVEKKESARLVDRIYLWMTERMASGGLVNCIGSECCSELRTNAVGFSRAIDKLINDKKLTLVKPNGFNGTAVYRLMAVNL